MVLDHLARLFGPEASEPVQYLERDWSADPFTNERHYHPPVLERAYGHDLFDRPYLGGRVMFAGTETTSEHGGHMEGALASGERAARFVIGAANAAGAS